MTDPILVEWARHAYATHVPSPPDDRGLTCDERGCAWCNGDGDMAEWVAEQIETDDEYGWRFRPDEDDYLAAQARLLCAAVTGKPPAEFDDDVAVDWLVGVLQGKLATPPHGGIQPGHREAFLDARYDAENER